MRIYISHATAYDYETCLYAPLLTSAVARDHDLYLPHSKSTQPLLTRPLIEQSDLVIAEVSLPATGQGIELGWADTAAVPIVCIHRADCTPSRSLQLVAKRLIAYGQTDSLLEAVEQAIALVNAG